MRRDLLRTSALALAFVGSVGLAAAQQQSPPADAQQQSQQETREPRPIGAQQTPSGKMGKEEPSSHAATAQPQQNAVFVNGALAVPDAPREYGHGAGEILTKERGRRRAHHNCVYVQDARRR